MADFVDVALLPSLLAPLDAPPFHHRLALLLLLLAFGGGGDAITRGLLRAGVAVALGLTLPDDALPLGIDARRSFEHALGHPGCAH